MNIGNEYLFSTTKGKKVSPKIKKKIISKINIKRNIKLMNDPAFHLNKTLKEYIANKLNKNKSTEKILVMKGPKELKIENGLTNLIHRINERNNNFNRIKTMTNIMKKNKTKILSNKRKIKVKNPNKTNKKMKKSMSNTKINLTHYILDYHSMSKKKKNKIYLNQKIDTNFFNTNSFNKTHKNFRSPGSIAFSFNDTNNQNKDKNNNLIIYNNKYKTSHSTLDVHSLKTPSTDKKNKIISQYSNVKINSHNIVSNEKTNDSSNIKTNNNINNNNKNIIINNIESNTIFFNDNKNKKKYNNKNNSVIIINTNINNKTDDNIKYSNQKKFNKENNLSKMDNNNKECHTITNKVINDYKCNIYNENAYIIEKDKNRIKKENSFEYLKKIEMLENENKLLKGEISESKNRLIILENKIDKLLGEKNLIENEECPQPMPYVKKYSAQTCINFYPSMSPMNDIDKDKEKEKEKQIIIKDKEIKNNNSKKVQFIKNKLKNKKIDYKNKNKKNNNQNKYFTYKTSMNLTPKKKSNHLKSNKSISCLRKRNNTDIHLKTNFSNKSHHNIIKKKIKKKSWKKINNLLSLENNNLASKSPLLRSDCMEEKVQK